MKLYVGDSHGMFDTLCIVVQDAIAALAASGLSVDEVISVGDFGFWPSEKSFRHDIGGSCSLHRWES